MSQQLQQESQVKLKRILHLLIYTLVQGKHQIMPSQVRILYHLICNELVLFLAAGILTVGLQTLVAATHMSLPFEGEFDAATATILLAGMVLLSVLGVHPVISIAIATPLLTPISPNSQLLAVTFVFSWSLGACASPLSGLNLMFQGRYGIPSTKLAMLNWQYVAVMFLVAAVFLHGAAVILGL